MSESNEVPGKVDTIEQSEQQQNPHVLALQTIAVCRSLLNFHAKLLAQSIAADASMESVIKLADPKLYSNVQSSDNYKVNIELFKIAYKFLTDYEEVLSRSERVRKIQEAAKNQFGEDKVV